VDQREKRNPLITDKFAGILHLAIYLFGFPDRMLCRCKNICRPPPDSMPISFVPLKALINICISKWRVSEYGKDDIFKEM